MKKHICLLSLLAILFSGSAYAQSKIKDGSVTGSGSLPNANALLDMESNKRGLLFPRVPLSSTASASPLTAHVAGMVVYNTANIADVMPGFYYNDGTQWIRIPGVGGSGGSGNNLSNDNGIIITGGTGATLTATSLRLDSTAIAKMMNQSPVKDSVATSVATSITTNSTLRDSIINSITNSTVFKDSITSIISTGSITGNDLTNDNGIIVTGGTGATLLAAGLRLDSTAVAKFMGQSPVKDSLISVVATSLTSGQLADSLASAVGKTPIRDSIINTVVSSTVFKDSLTTIIENGGISGQDLTNDNGIIVTGGTGATLLASSLRLDSTAVAKFMGQSPVKDSMIHTLTLSSVFKDSMTSLISSTSPKITGQKLSNDNGILVSANGDSAVLYATSLRLDSTAVAKFISQSPVKDSIATVLSKGPVKDSLFNIIATGLKQSPIADSLAIVLSSSPVKDSINALINKAVVKTKHLSFSAEYAGGVVTTNGLAGAGSIGMMSGDNDTTAGAWRNTYTWVSSETSIQKMNIILRGRIPDDFDKWAATTSFSLDYKTTNSGASDNAIDYKIVKASSGATVGTAVTGLSATGWTVATQDLSSSTDFAAGDYFVIVITMNSRNNQAAKVADLVLTYISK